MFCARLFICASWSPAGKGLASWLSFVVSSLSLSLSYWYPGSGVVLDCIDSWSLQPCLLFMQTKYLCVLIHIWIKVEVGAVKTGLSPPVKYFTDRSKAVLLLWIFHVFVLSCVCYVFERICFFGVTCWERADFLSLVYGVYYEFATFPLVSWVTCGTWLYRFLIFAPLLTLTTPQLRKLVDVSNVP